MEYGWLCSHFGSNLFLCSFLEKGYKLGKATGLEKLKAWKSLKLGKA